MGNETAERNAQYDKLQAEIDELSANNSYILNVLLPEKFNQIEASINKSYELLFSDAGTFYNTGVGQSISSDFTAVWAVMSVMFVVNLAMNIVGVMGFDKANKLEKNSPTVRPRTASTASTVSYTSGTTPVL